MDRLNSSGEISTKGLNMNGHGVVNPYVDGAPFALDALCRRFYLPMIGDIGLDHHCFCAYVANFPCGRF